MEDGALRRVLVRKRGWWSNFYGTSVGRHRKHTVVKAPNWNRSKELHEG